jgi:peptidoglycan/LPS O-acetylase OafA/YrhL
LRDVNTLGYRAELNGVRALAVSVVIGYHLALPGFGGGAIGVDWFFVLSGFLITTLLVDERAATGTIHLGRFYSRRLLRLVPPLLVMLAALYVASLLWVHVPGQEFVAAGLYLQNLKPFLFASSASSVFLLHTWSLALEEQFYVFWPLVIRVVRSTRQMCVIAALAVVLGVVARSFVAAGSDPSGWAAIPVFSLGGFGMGTLVALYVRRDRIVVLPAALVMAAAAVMMFDTVVHNSNQHPIAPWRGVLSDLAVAIVIVHLYQLPTGRAAQLLRWRPLVFVGLMSYSLYLWHFPVFVLISSEHLPNVPGALRFVLKMTVAGGLSWATYRYVERPMARVRSRLAAPAAMPIGRPQCLNDTTPKPSADRQLECRSLIRSSR